MKFKDFSIIMLSMILVILVIVTSISFSIVEDKNNIVDDLKEDVAHWKDLYLNHPKIVTETKTEYIYINTTEYITETLWHNDTIYLDNAIFDVNRDRVVDYYDACEVLWYVKNGASLVEELVFQKYGNPYEKLYDVNADGCVDLYDVDNIWSNCD